MSDDDETGEDSTACGWLLRPRAATPDNTNKVNELQQDDVNDTEEENTAQPEELRTFFDQKKYHSRADLTAAVQEYNTRVQRPYRVKSSDKRRYKVICTVPDCEFVVQFAFSHVFGPPTKFIPHSCALDQVNLTSSGNAVKRATHATSLMRRPDVRELVRSLGPQAMPSTLQKLLQERNGEVASYENCRNALRRLQNEFFGDVMAKMTPRKRGRPKTKTVENQVEPDQDQDHSTDQYPSLGPYKQIRKCQQCGGSGHNRRTCTSATNERSGSSTMDAKSSHSTSIVVIPAVRHSVRVQELSDAAKENTSTEPKNPQGTQNTAKENTDTESMII